MNTSPVAVAAVAALTAQQGLVVWVVVEQGASEQGLLEMLVRPTQVAVAAGVVARHLAPEAKEGAALLSSGIPFRTPPPGLRGAGP